MHDPELQAGRWADELAQGAAAMRLALGPAQQQALLGYLGMLIAGTVSTI